MYYILFCFLGVPRMGCIRVYRYNVTCTFTYAYVYESIDICLMQSYVFHTLFMPLYLNILSCFGRLALKGVVSKQKQAADSDGLY